MTELDQFSRNSERFSSRFYREIIASRMRPFADGIQGFPRLVRDMARKLGKKVRFEVAGETTNVDRDVLDQLEAPLNHLLRNAIDHGLELPAERKKAGKDETGTVRLEARHWAGSLYLTLADDGRGVDLERLRKKVVEKGLTNQEMAARLSDQELLEFMFLPGFSTAEQVTEYSGRGVGLDVVQNMVQSVRGKVRIESTPGRGAVFHLQLPITLSIIKALLVEIAAEIYAFPLMHIDRSLQVSATEIKIIGDRQYVEVDGRNIGLVPAWQILDLAEAPAAPARWPVVSIGDRTKNFGVVVDRFLGEVDLVVRPLDPRLGKVPDLNAAAILEDGTPVIIFDVEDLVRSIDNFLNNRRLRHVGGPGSGKKIQAGPKKILVCDDSLTVREVQRQLLENHGFAVDLAVDGMDGWYAARKGSYDLIITDVDMPRMNGLELVEKIKQDPALKTIPVMIVSYKEREEDRLRGLDAGANYYLTKSSFHDDTLINAVRDLIGES
jgi:two-component system sensor histidine kinase and response regulator WspE